MKGRSGSGDACTAEPSSAKTSGSSSWYRARAGAPAVVSWPAMSRVMVRLRSCPSLWTASPGSVGGRVRNGVNNLAQTLGVPTSRY